MTVKVKTKEKKGTALARRGGLVPAVARVATEIRDLIETARSHVSVTANLALVHLYWNIGRIITQDIQKNEKRAEYGTELMKQLSKVLTRDYGQGYSATNLWDMKRFFGCFEILQPAAGESGPKQACQPEDSLEIRRLLSAESSERLQIDFRKHFRLGWTHYRMLLGVPDPMQRRFYFEQAAGQRWSKRELRRQMDRGLFERVALSKNTQQLVVGEKQKGPTEVVRYEDIFKDPYVLDFLGLKGAYSEKDLEMKVAEYRTRLPDKRVLEERLKIYSRLLQKGEA